jgi:hypothetical protein
MKPRSAIKKTHGRTAHAPDDRSSAADEVREDDFVAVLKTGLEAVDAVEADAVHEQHGIIEILSLHFRVTDEEPFEGAFDGFRLNGIGLDAVFAAKQIQ